MSGGDEANIRNRSWIVKGLKSQVKKSQFYPLGNWEPVKVLEHQWQSGGLSPEVRCLGQLSHFTTGPGPMGNQTTVAKI